MKESQVWNRKDLIGLADLSAEEIAAIFQEARVAKKEFMAGVRKGDLGQYSLAFIFSEPSTRTRTSFEVAARKLGIEVLGFSASASSSLKGESLTDTLHNLEAMGVRFFVIRHETSGVIAQCAPKLKAHVLNAGDGSNEHPTQALLDLFTIQEKKGGLEGLKVVIVGDILHSRVARSNIWGLKKFNAKVTVCAPPTLIPADIRSFGVEVESELERALEGADVVNVLRLQTERQKENLIPSLGEYYSCFGLTWDKLAKAKKDCIVLHPGPLNRGVEISSEVADGPQSAILEQVSNGVAVRMAALRLLSKSRPPYR